MDLADLIDLEAQLGRDREADPARLESRDRALAQALPRRRRSRGEVLRGWLDLLREREPGLFHPGRAVARSVALVRAALVVAGLLLGWGTAAAVLQYTGGHPVDVWTFLLVFVGAQLALLLLLLASLAVPVGGAGAPVAGIARGLVAAAYPRLAARALGGAERAQEWSRLWHRLRSRRSLYRHVEGWLLLSLTQGFGVAFNLAALVACLRLVTFSDLAFSWSTTLPQLDAARFHAIVRALATPWAWAWPDAVPSRELVEATRYSRLESAYVGAEGIRAARPELVGGWWPFLVSALGCYGLLPRAATLAVATWRARRLLGTLPLDDVEVARLHDRLTGPHVETRAGTPERPAPAWPAPPAAAQAPPAGRCCLVLWRDAPAQAALDPAVRRRAGAEVASVQPAGGRDHEEGAVDWSRVAAGVDLFVVVAEAWEAPDRGALRLLSELRRALGARRALRVVLIAASDGAVGAPAPGDVRLWRDGLARLADPYLAVEAVGEAA